MTPPSRNNILQQIASLRHFCVDRTDYELTDCLRQCGYNVERAAEQLLTGQYGTTKSSSSSSSSSTKRARSTEEKRTDTATAVTQAGVSRHEKMVARARTNRLSLSSKKQVTPLSSLPQNASAQKLSTVGLDPTDATITDNTGANYTSSDRNSNTAWILCRRWISDAICTTRGGHTKYLEPLVLQWSSSSRQQQQQQQTGSVWFRGTAVEGKLPHDVARLLVPLLRAAVPMITITAHTLMATNTTSNTRCHSEECLTIGSHIPIQLTVMISNPKAFFQVFDVVDNSALRLFQKPKPNARQRTKELSLVTAAFDLLQWAEYGNVPEFSAPVLDADDNQVDDKSPVEPISVNEDDLEQASVATEQGQEIEKSIQTTTDDWCVALEEDDEPDDLVAHGVWFMF
jgi:hypothetical protein